MVTPPEAAEQQEKEALRSWSSSKYALLESGPTISEKAAKVGSLSDLFLAHTNTLRAGDGRLVDVSDVWDENGFIIPADENELRVYSKRGFKYPYIRFELENGLPDLRGYAAGDVALQFGFHIGDQDSAMFSYSSTGDSEELEQHMKILDSALYHTITGELPANHRTDKAWYGVKLNRGTAEFWINGNIAAVAVGGVGTVGGNPHLKINPPPYGIGTNTTYPVPHSNHAFMRWLASPDEEFTFDCVPEDLYVAEGSPCPPRTWSLYDAGADTLLTEGTYDTGTSYKSHPIPVAGYDSKTLFFRADTDSVTDGLAVEVLTQEGNWRTYDTITASANSLESYIISGDFPLVRIGYEPSADGASITDAELTVR